MREMLARVIAQGNIISLAVMVGGIILWLGIRKAFAAYCGGQRQETEAQTLCDVIKYAFLLGAALTVLQIYHINWQGASQSSAAWHSSYRWKPVGIEERSTRQSVIRAGMPSRDTSS